MQNIEVEKIQLLKQQSGELYQTFNLANEWVSTNLKHEVRDQVLLQVKNGRRIVRKIQQSIDSKPVFALFGASQVGKSYLVENLLSPGAGKLPIPFGKKTYDFLTEINPEGKGEESTGVVTRFTSDVVSKHPEFPVKVKLLTPKDLILILCEGFFGNLEKINYPSSEDFLNHLKELETKYNDKQAVQNILTEDDILDLQEYFNECLDQKVCSSYAKTINATNFWLRLGQIIDRVSDEEWEDAVSILWNRNSEFNELFKMLVLELAKTNFATSVFAPGWAVLREEGAILDVKRLHELYTNNRQVKVADKEGDIFDLNLSCLSALSAELSLSVDKSVSDIKPFLQHTDILDFPGARSPRSFKTDELEKSIHLAYLRGKVTYLFNKYSNDFEINNLLFCMKDEKNEVTALPSLLNNWIVKFIGKDAYERENNINQVAVCPLFIILTFFNNQLTYDKNNDNGNSLDYKWDKRFQTFFNLEMVGDHQWDEPWTISVPVFNNFYFLRNFAYSHDTFDGFTKESEIKPETAIRADRIEFYEKLKNSFLNNSSVKKYIYKPEIAWENAATIGNDGSKLIIEQLEPAATNFVKINNYISKLQANQKSLNTTLERFYHSGDDEKKRKQALATGIRLQLELNKVFGIDPFFFSLFLRKLLLSEVDVYNMFHENLVSSRTADSFDHYTLFRSQFPQLIPDSEAYDQNLTILCGCLGLSSPKEVEAYLENIGIDLKRLFSDKSMSSATDLVEKLFQMWQKKIKFENFEELMQKGLSRSTFDEIRKLLISSVEALNLKEFLIDQVEKKTQGIQINRESEEFMAAVCTYYLNDFVVNFGFSYLQPSDLENISIIAPQLGKDIQSIARINSQPDSTELVSLFDFHGKENVNSIHLNFNPMIDSYNAFLVKMKAALVYNCGHVDYDITANDNLSLVLQKLNDLSFTV